MSKKVVVFDLDDTLIHQGFEEIHPILCLETENVINYLVQKGYAMAVASHNKSASTRLHAIKLHQHFAVVHGYVPECVTKNPHLQQIATTLQVPPSSVVLFDDLKSNIRAAKAIGVDAYLVNWKTGITMRDIEKANL